MIFIVICLALSGCVQKGVLFGELVDDEWVWFKNGDENTYSKYEGEIRKEVPNGQGTIISPDGTKYVGEFKNGFPNGQGTMTLPNRNKYVGKWKDGFPNGQGTETFSNGGKYVGEFKDGKRWKGTEYDKYGNIVVKFVDGLRQY